MDEVGEAELISQAITPTSTPKGIEAAKETHAKDDTAYKI